MLRWRARSPGAARWCCGRSARGVAGPGGRRGAVCGSRFTGGCRRRTGRTRSRRALIWLSLILMPILSELVRSFYNHSHVFLVLEIICIMAFSVSFILKGHGQPASPDFDKTAAGKSPPAAVPTPADV
jgi:hypothetical protein